MLDYIVVGLGLSGISVCAQLEEQGLSYKVIADGQRMASTVAGGVYNPVVLKRLTPTWNGVAFLEYARPFYRKLEGLLNVKLLHEQPILRRFANAEEQNNWYSAADQPMLDRFLSTPIRSNENKAIKAPYGFGQVRETGRVDVPLMLDAYEAFLMETNRLMHEEIEWDDLEVQQGSIRYKTIESKKMILAMGYRALESPWFNYLPIQGNKGEVLVIEAPDLKVETILKAADFVIPLGNDQYKVGATYDPKDMSMQATEASKSRILRNLANLINCSFKVLHHEVGIRPTVPDRRPLVGVHHNYQNLGILNGLGSRGVLLAPKMAFELVQHIEHGRALDAETDIIRYHAFYEEV